MKFLLKISNLISQTMLLIILSPSLQSFIFPPAEAIRSPHFINPHQIPTRFPFRKSSPFHNAAECTFSPSNSKPCDPSLLHIAITLDQDYLRGSIAAVHSVLQHALCPENIFFHFLVSDTELNHKSLLQTAFPNLRFKVYFFNPERVRGFISTSVRQALEQPLNYARNYLADLLQSCVRRVIYLDSDVIVVDDIAKLWVTDLRGFTVGAPEYCHANFTKYFNPRFWADPILAGTFDGRRPCYFNTGVMVLDLDTWRRAGSTRSIERWMQVQKGGAADAGGGGGGRIYELGSLPPFLLLFAGHVAAIEHRWNQHGLGGDNVRGSCRDLHSGPVSLLHWSGSGKPWVRLDSNRPCPVDSVWANYDLYEPV